MITTLLPAADRIATPWKNGGGVTREIAAWPEGAGLDDFDWRISMAEVREPGPFSAFADVDRCLMVIEGRLSLAFPGERSVCLDDRSAPLMFPGDRACRGHPVEGPVLDLNVMCRRGRFQSRAQRVSTARWRPSGDVALLIALEPLSVADDPAAGPTVALAAFDALLYAVVPPRPAFQVNGLAIGVSIWSL